MIARDPAPDASIALLRDGYRFTGERARRLGSDAFETRLLLRKTVCMFGADAARLFYDDTLFARHGAMPRRVQKTLTGEGGVQGLDGAPHQLRKQLFMSLLDAAQVERLSAIAARRWQRAIGAWEAGGQALGLFEHACEVLCSAVCEWAGVPLAEPDAVRRARDFGAMIAGAGRFGPAHWAGRRARRDCERWIAGLVEDVRADALAAEPASALHTVAMHRDADGRPMPPRIAAVELINVLRPTVAAGYYVCFAALALHEHPQWRARVAAADGVQAERFAQEVRRFYPFFPMVAARVREPFEWHGYRFRKGLRVMLDLYATDHDERVWQRADEFYPERFGQAAIDPFALIPQGGGDAASGHRCPGERVVIEQIKLALRALTQWMAYDVPPQDLSVDLARIPTLPRSGFVISGVRRLAAAPPSHDAHAGRGPLQLLRSSAPPGAAPTLRPLLPDTGRPG